MHETPHPPFHSNDICNYGLADGSREVVERRVYTVTGKQVSEDEVERMIETGESETIFQKAILEQGRGHVSCRLI